MKYETNYKPDFSKRKPHSLVDELFYSRWSPRSYKKVDISTEILESVFEAARWAPSCFNEQPWLFITNKDESDFDLYLGLLDEWNQKWAKNASKIGFICAKRHFARNGEENDWAQFDSGAAWMSLALQAQMHGLYTHCMAGIKNEDINKTLNIPTDKYDVIAGFTIGMIDVPDKLPEDIRKSEAPNKRNALSESWIEGAFK